MYNYNEILSRSELAEVYFDVWVGDQLSEGEGYEDPKLIGEWLFDEEHWTDRDRANLEGLDPDERTALAEEIADKVNEALEIKRNRRAEILARDRERAKIFRAAMDTVAEILDEAETNSLSERLYELLDTMKRTEVDLYAWEVYTDGYVQPGADWDY